jgi:hypothetical protein
VQADLTAVPACPPVVQPGIDHFEPAATPAYSSFARIALIRSRI